MPIKNGKSVTSIPGIHVKTKDAIHDAVIQFDAVTSAPTTTSGYYYLYTNGTNIYWNNGSSAVALNGGSGTIPSWETLYAADPIFAMTATGWTITQSAAAMVLTLTKTSTSSGSPFVINNAGTGDDIQIVNTDTGSTGVIISTDFQTASPADNDVMFTLEVNGFDDGGAANEYANIKFIATDVSAGTEDAKITIANMVGGTSRTVMDISSTGLILGYGSNVTLTSQGAYDLILSTNEGTNSGTITITDGAAGAIALAPDTTGVVTITTGLQVGGGTPTASIFNVAGTGGGGTTGYGFKVNASTLTTGTAFLVDSASTSSGLLLDLQLASSSVFSVSETGAVTIAGSETANVITVTKGDVLVSDGSITIVDDDSAVSFQITNDTATTTNVVDINADALTSGFILHLDTSAAGLTTGGYIECYDGAAQDFTVGLYGATVIAGNASTDVLTVTAGHIKVTAGNYLSTLGDAIFTDGSVSITNTANETAFTIVGDAVTDGIVIDVNADAVTTGTILHLDSSAAGFSGKYIDCFDGAASDFAIGLYGATTIAGNAGSDVFTVTAGDLVVADGSLTMTDADEASTLAITNNTAASVNVVSITANGITDGSVLYLNSSAAGITTGNYINCYNGAATVFEVGLYGATTILGNAATEVFTITAGHAKLTSGNLTLTSGNVVLTSGNLTLTSGNIAMDSGNITVTAGNITMTAGTIINTPQAIVNANTAISVTHGVTTIANNAPSTHTMADGTVGQHKWIFCTVYTGDAVITPDNLANGTTVTFNAVGDGCEMIFTGTEWWVVNLYGTAALA